MSCPQTHHSILLNRRSLLAGLSVLAIAPSAYAEAADPIASTRSGKVRGRNAGAVKVFKGIPYGADTAGNRFLPPKPPVAWTDVKDCGDFGHSSPQLGADRPAVYASWNNPRPSGEDCLVLNVFTNGLRDGRARPVMVWFHGGGFTSGSASSLYADGTRLAARNDVVVVTVNHRLNSFGYLYLGEIGGEQFARSGNVGSMDMVQSLRWVRDNIAEFGGDPGNVTIFGQSGGGGKVSTLMATPSAAGLFHKAIVQSGSTIKVQEKAAATANARKLMAALGVRDAPGLQKVPMQALTDTIEKGGYEFRPVVDGVELLRHPFDPDAPAISANVPLLVGCNRTESSSLQGGRDESLFKLTWDTLPGRLAPTMKAMDANATIAALRKLNPDASPTLIYFIATSDYSQRRRAILQAERKAAAGKAPAFMYYITWETPVDGGKWHTPHSVEHAFVFDNVAVSASMVGPAGTEQQAMADAMSGAWTTFARTGSPGWAAFDASKRQTMIFSKTPSVVSDPLAEERKLFERAPV